MRAPLAMMLSSRASWPAISFGYCSFLRLCCLETVAPSFALLVKSDCICLLSLFYSDPTSIGCSVLMCFACKAATALESLIAAWTCFSSGLEFHSTSHLQIPVSTASFCARRD